MEFIFYYKEKGGVEHISYRCCDDDSQAETYGKIGSTDKLIEFINRHCLKISEVFFVDFTEKNTLYILNNISDDIEIIYPPIGYEGPFQMLKKLPKVRGK